MKAIPPQDYEGTMGDWIQALQKRGYDGIHFYDVEITDDEWRDILYVCEKKP